MCGIFGYRSLCERFHFSWESCLGVELLGHTYKASQVVLVVKNPSANAGDLGSIRCSGRSPGVRNSNRCSILAWKIQ